MSDISLVMWLRVCLFLLQLLVRAESSQLIVFLTVSEQFFLIFHRNLTDNLPYSYTNTRYSDSYVLTSFTVSPETISVLKAKAKLPNEERIKS